GFRADTHGVCRIADTIRHPGTQLRPAVAGQKTEGLAHGNVLSLLPLSPGPSRPAALRHPHGALQTDLLQQNRSMGTVRPAERPTRTEQCLSRLRLRRHAEEPEGR